MKTIEQLRSQITKLPEHSPEEIRIANKQLKNLEFSFNLGNLELDLFNMTKNDILKEIDAISAYDFEKLLATRNLEQEYRKGDDKNAWAEKTRSARIKLIVHEFTLLSRLRSDEPEAWDEVNELWFDD